jgi:hypothetical protein
MLRRVTSPATEAPVRSSGLREHLLRDHGRSEREIEGLPLADLLRFEHVEQAMGLNHLGHHHPTELGTRTGAAVAADEAPIRAAG